MKNTSNDGNNHSDLHEDECEKAISDFSKAIELNPDYQNTYQHGWPYVRIGEYDRAVVDFTKLVKVYPGVPGGFYSRGWAYAEKGDYAKAIFDFTELIKINPDSDEAYYSYNYTLVAKVS